VQLVSLFNLVLQYLVMYLNDHLFYIFAQLPPSPKHLFIERVVH
jgi:hypothetical protein